MSSFQTHSIGFIRQQEKGAGARWLETRQEAEEQMVDCTKQVVDLSPGDAVRCFFQAKDWEIIGGNARRMWESFTGTTISEWAAIILASALVPAELASVILPLTFVHRLAVRSRRPLKPAGEREMRLRTFWGIYLLICGGIIAAVYTSDTFMLTLGLWEAACGLAVFVLGPSWWAPLSVRL